MELYFAPMACSLASRIALYETGEAADFRRVQLASKTVEGGADFHAVAPKAQVPTLRVEGGRVLTENPAVLQFIADRRPESGLAPAAGTMERYELQTWLAYISSEIHKQVLWTTFAPNSPPEAKAFARTLIPAKLAYLDAHLATRDFLLGERFTVADAYLVWALLLFQRIGVSFDTAKSVGAYVQRCLARDAVRRAVADETALLAA